MELPHLRRIVKWIVLLAVYFLVTSFCVSIVLLPMQSSLGGGYGYQDTFSFSSLASGFLTIVNCVAPLGIIAAMMAGMVWIFNRDQQREHNPSDDFRRENLFYRYGYEINHRTLSIATQADWDDGQTQELARELSERIAARIRTHFSGASLEVTNPVNVTDRDKAADMRDFLKIIFRSMRGSQVSHFIYHAVLGKYIVIHYMTRVRGKYRWHDVVDFVISGPASFWFWIVDWVQNQYSVIAAISKFIGNSFDLIDLESYFEASYLVMMDETREFLKEKKLLTDELSNAINLNIIDASQNISVTNSKNVNMSGIVNAAQGMLQKMVP